MQIRNVQRSDRDEWQRMRACLYPCLDAKEIDEWFEAAYKGGTHVVGVAVLVADIGNSRLAGFIEIGSRNYAEGCESTPVAFLEGWYVDANARRSGLGRSLVKAAETWAVTHGYTEIASDTELENETGLQAHLALGYVEVERQICFRKQLHLPS